VLEYLQGGRVVSMPGRVDPTDPQAAIAAMPRTAGTPGRAWVRWRVVTADGHVASGLYPVQVGAGGTASPASPTAG